MSATMTRPDADLAGQTSRTVSIELELELDYVGLSDREIRGRCLRDQEAISEAIGQHQVPALPGCIKAIRFENYGNGPRFPDAPAPNPAGS